MVNNPNVYMRKSLGNQRGLNFSRLVSREVCSVFTVFSISRVLVRATSKVVRDCTSTLSRVDFARVWRSGAALRVGDLKFFSTLLVQVLEVSTIYLSRRFFEKWVVALFFLFSAQLVKRFQEVLGNWNTCSPILKREQFELLLEYIIALFPIIASFRRCKPKYLTLKNNLWLILIVRFLMISHDGANFCSQVLKES